MSPVLEIHELILKREKRIVLRVDHLTVEKGEIIALIGPNGAGKSSLLLAICKLLRPVQGSIKLFSKNVSDTREIELRRRIAMVMQEPFLIDASVRDNISLGLRYRNVNEGKLKSQVEIWASKLHIEKLLDTHANKISGGEAQRVSLARAFVLEPELLLLDEPFSALDPKSRKSILSDLHSILAESKTTVIMVTHDMNDVAKIADQVGVIQDGELTHFGKWEVIKQTPHVVGSLN